MPVPESELWGGCTVRRGGLHTEVGTVLVLWEDLQPCALNTFVFQSGAQVRDTV